MILSFVVSILSARYLGPANYGLIQYANSLISFMMPIMQLGFASILVNELISNPHDEGKLLGTATVSCACSAMITMPTVVLFAFVANDGDTQTVVVCAIMSLNLFLSALEMCQYWFQAKLQSKFMSVVSLLSYFLVSVYKVFLLITQKNVYWFAFSYVLELLLIDFALFIIYRKLGGQRFSFSFTLAKNLFTKGKYYIVSDLMISVFAQTDRVMLYSMVDSAVAGQYSAAMACAGLMSFVFGAIIDSYRPVILESRLNNFDAFELNVKRLYCIVIYLSLGVNLIMIFGAKWIIEVLYGTAYLPAISALRILTLYTTFSYLGIIRNVWILAEKKQKYLWILNLTGAVANVGLNFLLIPYMGIDGAALATLLTQFTANVGISFILRPVRRSNILMLQAFRPKLLIDIVESFFKSWKSKC